MRKSCGFLARLKITCTGVPVGRKGNAGVKQRRESISFPAFNIWFMSWNGVGEIGKNNKNHLGLYKARNQEFQYQALYSGVTLVILAYFIISKNVFLENTVLFILSGTHKLHEYDHNYNCKVLVKEGLLLYFQNQIPIP